MNLSNQNFEKGIYSLPDENVDSKLSNNLSRNSSEEECGCYLFTETELRIITGILIMQSTLGVVLNIITILAISFGKKTGRKVKLQLINLAVADCLMALFVVPGYTYVDQLFLSTSLQCKLYFFTYQVTVHAGLNCNAVISIERAFIVLFPLYEKRYRKVHKICVIVFIWLCTTLAEIEQLLDQELIELNDYGHEYGYCSGTDSSSHYYLNMLIRFIVPVSVIFISYTAILLKLCLRRWNSLIANTSTDQHRASQKVLIMLAVDALLTLITWLPFNIFLVFDSEPLLDKNASRYLITEVTLYMLMGTNAFSTPVVYFIFSKNFRHDVVLLCNRTLIKTKSIKPQIRAELKDSDEEATPSSQSTGLSDKAV
ncbi:rhodopsin-like [Watersipora subatra]|uniref:rhodopsin-like n=1 Tax=Watersipora subatra TaxID=2589382 RepID=UPI00355C20D7